MIIGRIFIFLALSTGKRHGKEEKFEGKIFCLERSRLIRLDRDGEAVIVDAIFGHSVLLKCSYCDDGQNFEPRVWLYWNVSTGESKELVTHDRLKITPLNSLIIQNMSQEDSGFYFCRLPYDDSVQTSLNFLVDVQDEFPVEDLWKGDFTNWVNYSMLYFVPVNTEVADLETSGIKFEVFSAWSSWSKCETCKANPIQQRIGRCRVKPSPNSLDYPITDPAVPKVVLKVLIQTASALPCRGDLLRKIDPDLSGKVLGIPDFVIEKSCEAVCPKTGSRDQKRLILEEGGQAQVPCRGDEGGKVRWEHDRRRIKSASKDGTVAVDRFGVLHFVAVTKASKGNYVCFSSDNFRVYEIQVVISFSTEWGLGKEFQRHALYLAILTVISFWIFALLNCGFCFLKKWKKETIAEKMNNNEDMKPLLEDDNETDHNFESI